LIKPYRGAEVPASEHCFKLELKPSGWKARIWRSFDDSVQPMVRLEASLHPRDIENRDHRDLLDPFSASLQHISVYLERGAGAPLPVPWSIGRLSVERDKSVGFLHRVLDDPIGVMVASLFRVRDSRADVTLSVSPWDVSRDRLVFAIRDYDLGVGSDFAR
jgi:hypothetical protein